jgi:hypothetical protein
MCNPAGRPSAYPFLVLLKAAIIHSPHRSNVGGGGRGAVDVELLKSDNSAETEKASQFCGAL